VFANWFRDWIAVIQQSHVYVESVLPENILAAHSRLARSCSPVGTSRKEFPVL